MMVLSSRVPVLVRPIYNGKGWGGKRNQKIWRWGHRRYKSGPKAKAGGHRPPLQKRTGAAERVRRGGRKGRGRWRGPPVPGARRGPVERAREERRRTGTEDGRTGAAGSGPGGSEAVAESATKLYGPGFADHKGRSDQRIRAGLQRAGGGGRRIFQRGKRNRPTPGGDRFIHSTGQAEA